MGTRNRYQFLGYIIQRGVAGWWVLDWDYEHEEAVHRARSERAAQEWIEARS